MTFQDRKDALALLILRLGLAWFICLWAIHKILAPKQYQFIARRFDDVDMSLAQVYLVAAVQTSLCILVALGVFRIFSYGGLAMMHLFTVTRR